jgi:outer membrane protein assembly factor BamA
MNSRPASTSRSDRPFGAGRLDADISAIEALYRQRGYASVRAQPSLRIGAVDPSGVVPVAISIAILEGRRTLIDRIGYAGNPSVDAGNLTGGDQLAGRGSRTCRVR